MKESKFKIFLDKHGREIIIGAAIVSICLFVIFTAIGVKIAIARYDEPETTTPDATHLVEIETVPPETTVPPTTVPAPTEPPAPPEPEIDPEEVEMLAIVIYQEAGGDRSCDDCRRRVADIVLNRVESPYYPDDIHSVLTRPYQYGRLYWTGVVWPERASRPGEKHAVERARRIAEEVLRGEHSDVYGTGMNGQAEYSVFEKYWNGGKYIHHCGIYFFKTY